MLNKKSRKMFQKVPNTDLLIIERRSSMECFSNCSSLNLTSCSLLNLDQLKPVSVRQSFLMAGSCHIFYAYSIQVVYDENGCYDRRDYFGEENKYQHYMQV